MREEEDDDPHSLLLPQQHQQDPNLIQYTCLESKKLWQVAAPSIFSRLAMFFVTVVTESFAGHLSYLDLATISISTTVITAITFGFMPEDVAEQTGLVCMWLIPFHLSFPFQMTLQRFLQCQQKTGVFAWVCGGVLVIHVFVSWVFVYELRVGIVGTALTIGLAWWLSVLGFFWYVVCGGCKDTWTGFSAQAFVGVLDFFKLSLASGLMLLYVPGLCDCLFDNVVVTLV